MVEQRVAKPDQHMAEPPPQEILWRMTSGCLLSQAIHVATKLDIPGLLTDGPKSSAEIAQATNTHAPSMYRLMRALASAGIFVEDDQKRFELTRLGQLLRRDVPGSMAAAGLLFGSTLQWETLGELLYSLQSGKPSFEHHFGMSIWQYYAGNPEERELFQYAMSSFSAAESHAILQAYDFSPFQTVIDVAGGQGQLLVSILKAYPDIRGTLLELPDVVRQAEGVFTAAGVDGRCEAISGDMFVSIPAGRDAYIMKTVAHDWEDEKAKLILQQCEKAMPAHAKLLVISDVMAPANIPDPSKFMDLTMLVSFGGRERTAADFEALFEAAGLKLNRIIPTRSPLKIVECVKR